MLTDLKTEIQKWENHINVEKLAGNIVKESVAKGVVSGLQVAVMIIEQRSKCTCEKCTDIPDQWEEDLCD